MSFPKLAAVTLGAALAFAFATAGQAAPMSHSRQSVAAPVAGAPVVKSAAKTHKSTKKSKPATQGTEH
jgi:hypothetical protein